MTITQQFDDPCQRHTEIPVVVAPGEHEQITHMVNRFLQWKLPKDFQPDCGIHFDANAAKKLNPNNHTYEPVGTNLLSADQAEKMVRFMIDGLANSGTTPTADSAVPDGREGLSLRATVENDQLSIVIGVRTLAWAFEHGEDNNPFNEASGDYEQRYWISDPLQFAKDVCHEINGESEDGSTPLTRFLDSMMDRAVEQGSLGIHDPDETSDSAVSEHSEIRSEA